MHEPQRERWTRRALFTAAGVGAMTIVAGCKPFSTSARTVTVTAGATSTSPPPAPSTTAPAAPAVPILGLVATTQLQVQHLEAAVLVDKRDAATLTMLLHDRQAHLAALRAEYARSVGETTLPAAPTTTTGTDMPNDPAEVIGRIRADATTAQNMFTDALAGATRYQAELYASIAACVATHRMVLA